MNALLNWMIFIPTIGGLLCLAAPKNASKWLALATSLVTLALSIVLAYAYYGQHCHRSRAFET